MSANNFLPPSPVIPAFELINAVTRSYPMLVTVENAGFYVAGQLIYFSVPASYGMVQLNGLTGQILDVNSLVFSVDIDSTMFDPFVPPASGKEAPATISPAGSRNLYNFIEVPFHSEGNFGN